MSDQQGNETKPVGTASRLVIEGVGIIQAHWRGGYVGSTQDGRLTNALDSPGAAEKALRDLAGQKMPRLNEDELACLVEEHSRGLVFAAWSDDRGPHQPTFESHANRLRELRNYWGENLAAAVEDRFDPDNHWVVVGSCGQWLIAYSCSRDRVNSYGPCIGCAFEDGLVTTWILAEKEVLRRILTHPDWKSANYSAMGCMVPTQPESQLNVSNTSTEGKTTK